MRSQHCNEDNESSDSKESDEDDGKGQDHEQRVLLIQLSCVFELKGTGNLANSRRLFTFLRILGHSMALFGVGRGLKMVLSHMASSCPNISSYRAI